VVVVRAETADQLQIVGQLDILESFCDVIWIGD